MKQRFRWFMIAFIIIFSFSLVVGCNQTKSTTSDTTAAVQATEKPVDSAKGPVTLRFMYWGSNFEQAAIEGMVKKFEASHANIKINLEHVNVDDANAKFNTLMATNDLPDISYIREDLALKWGEEGKVLDMTPYMDQYPQLKNRLPQTYYVFAPGKNVGTNTAGEIFNLFYNKDLFKEENVELPPASADKAWNWDKFVEMAKKLTKDKNGKHPDDAGFDANNIVQYGVSFPTWWGGWYPFLASSGGDIANADGTKYTMNSPEAVDAFQKLQDLIYKNHVAPSALQQQNMPATSIRLQTKKVAIAVDGYFNILDFKASKLNYGIGVLPKIKEAKTLMFGGPTIIFTSTKHPKEALEFYMYHNDPEQVDLFAKGLWMPLESKYYTDPAFTDKWIKNDNFPPETKQAVVDYAINNSVRAPSYTLKNWDKLNPAIQAVTDRIFTNKGTAKQILDDAEKELQPLLNGRYPSK